MRFIWKGWKEGWRSIILWVVVVVAFRGCWWMDGCQQTDLVVWPPDRQVAKVRTPRCLWQLSKVSKPSKCHVLACDTLSPLSAPLRFHQLRWSALGCVKWSGGDLADELDWQMVVCRDLEMPVYCSTFNQFSC